MSRGIGCVPSVAELTEIREACESFRKTETSWSWFTWQQENVFLPAFCRLADALRPVRALVESTEGWPHRVGRALRLIIEEFDAITKGWEWEMVAAPEPERGDFIKKQKARFLEEAGRPLYEAALSWQAGCQSLYCQADFFAEEGAQRGFKATMSPEEGKSQFNLARKRWQELPRFGPCIPGLDNERRRTLALAVSLIDSDLRRISLPVAASSSNPSNAARKLQSQQLTPEEVSLPEAVPKLIPPVPESESIENRALAMALRMIQSGEKLSITAIAKSLGCQRTYLYTFDTFKAFINAHRKERKALPRGRKDRKTGDLEAWDGSD